MESALEVRDIMGVAVVAAHTDEVIACLDDDLARGRVVRLAFLNAHTSNLAASDEAFARVLSGFTVLNDGVGVDLASRRLHGASFPDNLNGTDLVPRLLRELTTGRRIYLLGGRPGVAEEAAQAIAALAPQHRVVGTQHGYFAPETAVEVASRVAATRAEIVLVAMGNPVQELFIVEHGAAMGAPLTIGVGALLDFLAGRVVRAPQWVQRLRLEWAHRLVLEPGRLWRRYLLGNVRFLVRLLRTPR